MLNMGTCKISFLKVAACLPRPCSSRVQYTYRKGWVPANSEDSATVIPSSRRLKNSTKGGNPGRGPCQPLTMLLRVCGRHYCLSEDEDVHTFVAEHFKLLPENYWLDDRSEDCISVRLRLPGGKGGFGSQLRAQGNKMSSKKRAGNYEACRDLSGRRLRTVNQTKLINEYLKRKPELDAAKEEAIKDKMEKATRAPDQKVVFQDVDFIRTTRDITDEVGLAVAEAIYGKGESDDEDSKEKLPVRPLPDLAAELDFL